MISHRNSRCALLMSCLWHRSRAIAAARSLTSTRSTESQVPREFRIFRIMSNWMRAPPPLAPASTSLASGGGKSGQVGPDAELELGLVLCRRFADDGALIARAVDVQKLSGDS